MDVTNVGNTNATVLSVVIPVLNVENYLPTCLDSLLRCELRDCEVILVVGKSTDKSNEICEDYKKRNPFIQIVNQSGSGLSNARNSGYALCNGKYILFIDSDDFVCDLYFSEMLNELRNEKNAELYVTDFKMVSETSKETFSEQPIFQIGENVKHREGMDFLPLMLRRRQCFWNVWRYIYRKDFLDKNELRFTEGILSEDIDFTTRVLMANPDVVFMHCPYYCYRVARKESLMGSVTEKRFSDTHQVIKKSIEALEQSEFIWKQQLIEQYQFEWVLDLAQLMELQQAVRSVLCKKSACDKSILLIGTDRLSHLMYVFLSLFGVKAVSAGLYVLKKAKRAFRNKKIKNNGGCS